MNKIAVTDAMTTAFQAAWNRPNGSLHAAIEAAFALIPQPDERRMTAERAVVETVMAVWRDFDHACSGLVQIACAALHALDPKTDHVEDLLAAIRFDTNIKSARVCRAALALDRERKGMKS